MNTPQKSIEQMIQDIRESCDSEIVIANDKLYLECAECVLWKKRPDTLVEADKAYISPGRQAFCNKECSNLYMSD